MPSPAVPLSDDAPHVLVVDDDRRLRTLLNSFLSKNGYRVTTAASAAEARTFLTSLEFDLMVLDVMMPGESGLELARSLRETSNIPILMLTARSEAADRVRGLETGVDDYLGKPYERTGVDRGPRRRPPRSGPPTIPTSASAPSASTWSAANCGAATSSFA